MWNRGWRRWHTAWVLVLISGQLGIAFSTKSELAVILWTLALIVGACIAEERAFNKFWDQARRRRPPRS